MPNLPTSLILVLLAIAWLWVLVPMFARSREAVPETDDGAAGFRVLRRAGSRLRRPASHRRDAEEEDEFVADDEHETGDLVEALVDADDVGTDFDDDFDDDDFGDDDFGDVEPYASTAYTDDRHVYDAADDWESSHPAEAAPRRDRPVARPSNRPQAAPMHRPGRGGFDPEHDAAAAAFRYRRRRFVTLLLVLLTGGLVAGAVLEINDKLWIGATVTALVLVGYLTYLSRQVRIEREISARRRARMQRAREIRPADHREAEPVSPYSSGRPAAQRQATHRSRSAAPQTGPAQRPAARSSHLPPMYRRVGTVVDLDDDDPAFDDLDHYEPVVYRRAAGQ